MSNQNHCSYKGHMNNLPHVVNIHNMEGYNPSATQRVQSSWAVVCCQEQWRGPSHPAQPTSHSPPKVSWLFQGRGPWLMASSPCSRCTTIISLCVNIDVVAALNSKLKHVKQTWRTQVFWNITLCRPASHSHTAGISWPFKNLGTTHPMTRHCIS